MASVCILLILSCIPMFGTSEYLTSEVNFEKLYRMEEELLTLADLMVKQEMRKHDQEDVHQLANITKSLDEVKSIHRAVGLRSMTYLKHPINQFHLIRRLYVQWREIVKRLLHSDTCVKALKVKLQNIEDNIPSDKLYLTIANGITELQFYQEMTVDEVMRGAVQNKLPLRNLSLVDAFDVAKLAYEREDYYSAIEWLSYIVEQIRENNLIELDEKLPVSSVYNTLATVYYKAGHIDDAEQTLKELLKRDPKNRSGKRNLAFFQTSRSTASTSKPLTRKKPSLKSKRLYEQLCKSPEKQIVSMSSKLKCLYFPSRSQVPYLKSNVKAEVVNGNPLILVLHDVFNNHTAKAIAYLGYKKLSDSTVINNRYQKSDRNNVPLYDPTHWKWIPKLQAKLADLKLSHNPHALFALKTFNIGTEGDFSKRANKGRIIPVGKFIPFFTVQTVGGEIVFPLSRVKIPIVRGNVVFAETRAIMGICPVFYGSQWYGSQELFEKIPSNQCPLKNRIPKF